MAGTSTKLTPELVAEQSSNKWRDRGPLGVRVPRRRRRPLEATLSLAGSSAGEEAESVPEVQISARRCARLAERARAAWPLLRWSRRCSSLVAMRVEERARCAGEGSGAADAARRTSAAPRTCRRRLESGSIPSSG